MTQEALLLVTTVLNNNSAKVNFKNGVKKVFRIKKVSKHYNSANNQDIDNDETYADTTEDNLVKKNDLDANLGQNFDISV